MAMPALLTRIDDLTAIAIARRFLEQHHSVHNTYAKLEKNQWIVTVQVGFLPTQVKKVRIDAKDGKIIQCV